MAPLDTVYSHYLDRGRAAAALEASGHRVALPAELARGALDPSLARRAAFGAYARGWCEVWSPPSLPPED